MEETKEELEEFQISSRELELELEAQLEQLESKNKDNDSQINKLQTDNDGLRVNFIYMGIRWGKSIYINSVIL